MDAVTPSIACSKENLEQIALDFSLAYGNHAMSCEGLSLSIHLCCALTAITFDECKIKLYHGDKIAMSGASRE